MKKLIIIILLCLSNVHANIIRDSEIEQTLDLILSPLAKAANIKNLKIYLINDNSLNAFTAGGNIIYLHSGVIKQFANINVIRGIIAHEIGHITAHHITKQSANINDYSKLALGSMAIGIATAIAGAADAGTILMLAGGHIAERSILRYSREYEFTADKTAILLLQKTGLSCKGMIEFFEHMKKGEKRSLINPYEQTHPISQTRLNVFRTCYQQSADKSIVSNKNLDHRFARARAKLIGFTSNPKQIFTERIVGFDEETNSYLKAIAYFKNSELNNALLYIDKLIMLRPNDPFYHELKGQILFEFGKKESLGAYNKALALRPDDLLIKLSRAIVAINIYTNSSEQLRQYETDLRFIVDKEKDNLTALYYLSVLYDKANQKSKSLLYLAIIALKNHDLAKAKKLAEAAIKDLIPQSNEWYKAHDIILTED